MGKKFLFTTFSLLSILMLLVMTAGTPLSAAHAPAFEKCKIERILHKKYRANALPTLLRITLLFSGAPLYNTVEKSDIS